MAHAPSSIFPWQIRRDPAAHTSLPPSCADPATPTVVIAAPLHRCLLGMGVLWPRMVMTASGKRGMGKTLTTANFSASLAQLGFPWCRWMLTRAFCNLELLLGEASNMAWFGIGHM